MLNGLEEGDPPGVCKVGVTVRCLTSLMIDVTIEPDDEKA
jgi:hypothetical protein